MELNLFDGGELTKALDFVFSARKYDGLELADVCAKYQELGFVAIHQSDLAVYKRCRRKWAFSSPFRLHLQKITMNTTYLWFGSGIHFALEDYFGYNVYGTPQEAFEAYYKAHRPEKLPNDVNSLRDLAKLMLDYFVSCYEKKKIKVYDKFGRTDRDLSEFETVYINDVPLLEVPFTLQLPEASDAAGIPIVVHGTFDRIVRDRAGKYYVLDWKTAKSTDVLKLLNDPQVTMYMWAGEDFLDIDLEGMLYVQLSKSVPHPPAKLKNGSFSQAANQNTTFDLYIEALEKEFGKVPSEYEPFLDKLFQKEKEEGDAYISCVLAERNVHQKDAWHQHLKDQVMEMIDPYLALYPNPTKDCSWDCDFRATCQLMDTDGDFAFTIGNTYETRTETAKTEKKDWRDVLKYDEGRKVLTHVDYSNSKW